jgi:hypothetical protein
MPTEELRHELAELADEVELVPLHRQAVARARRSARRTALLASVAAVAMLSGGVAGAGALTGDAAGPDAAAPGTAAGPQADATPREDMAGRLTGRFFGSQFHQSGADSLLTWRAGDLALTQITASDDPMFSLGVSVSPDGRYASWIDKRGRVHVRELRSGGQRSAGQIDMDTVCAEPVWAPDSRRLLVKVNERRAYFWDAETEVLIDVVAPRGCQVRVAAGPHGEDVLFSVDGAPGDVQVYRSDTAGRSVRTALAGAARDAGVHLVGLAAVSSDGRFACLGVNSDEHAYHQSLSAERSCTMIAEVDGNRVVDIGGGWFGSAAVFDAPGRILVTMDDGDMPTVLKSFGGEILDEAAAVSPRPEYEPPHLLRYVPEPTG